MEPDQKVWPKERPRALALAREEIHGNMLTPLHGELPGDTEGLPSFDGHRQAGTQSLTGAKHLLAPRLLSRQSKQSTSVSPRRKRRSAILPLPDLRTGAKLTGDPFGALDAFCLRPAADGRKGRPEFMGRVAKMIGSGNHVGDVLWRR
jgi:hypothetical protein